MDLGTDSERIQGILMAIAEARDQNDPVRLFELLGQYKGLTQASGRVPPGSKSPGMRLARVHVMQRLIQISLDPNFQVNVPALNTLFQTYGDFVEYPTGTYFLVTEKSIPELQKGLDPIFASTGYTLVEIVGSQVLGKYPEQIQSWLKTHGVRSVAA